MRVNPVLGWGYGDVWALLRAARLPYCALYDRGFTSIGSVTNTRPNRCARPPGAPAHARGAWPPLRTGTQDAHLRVSIRSSV